MSEGRNTPMDDGLEAALPVDEAMGVALGRVVAHYFTDELFLADEESQHTQDDLLIDLVAAAFSVLATPPSPQEIAKAIEVMADNGWTVEDEHDIDAVRAVLSESRALVDKRP